MNYMQKLWVKIYYEAVRANVGSSTRVFPSDLLAARLHADRVIESLTKLDGSSHAKQQ